MTVSACTFTSVAVVARIGARPSCASVCPTRDVPMLEAAKMQGAAL